MDLPYLGFASAVGRGAVGALLLVAGVVKLCRPPQFFQNAVLGYDIVPRSTALTLSHWIPRTEIIVGVFLLFGFLTKPAEAAGISLLCVMSSAVAYSLCRGRENHCGCLGFSAGRVSQVQWRIVYRNIFFIAILVADWAWESPLGIDRFLSTTCKANCYPATGFFALVISVGILAIGVVALQVSVRKRDTSGNLRVSHNAGLSARMFKRQEGANK